MEDLGRKRTKKLMGDDHLHYLYSVTPIPNFPRVLVLLGPIMVEKGLKNDGNYRRGRRCILPGTWPSQSQRQNFTITMPGKVSLYEHEGKWAKPSRER